MKREIIADGICGLFILLFVYTSITKFLGYENFKATLQHSPLIAGYAFLVAWLLPAAELFIACLLFIPATKKVGLYASLGIMVLFTGYIIYMLLFVANLPCSCGGIIARMSWREHLVFNLISMLLAITGLKMVHTQGES